MARCYTVRVLRRIALLASQILPYRFKAVLTRVPGLRRRIKSAYRGMLAAQGETFTTSQGLAAGLRWRLSPSIGRAQLQGEYEKPLQETLASTIQPGWVIMDLGAHIGFFTLLSAKLTGPTGEVVAFEPCPGTFSELQGNIAVNDFANVTAYPFAIDAQSSSVEMQVGDNSYLAHIVRGEKGEFRVEAKSLDELVYREGFPPPNFIKIDVEGAELEVLKGATRLLSELRPVVLCELHDEGLRPGVLSLLYSLGYRISWPEKNHILAVRG